MSTMATPPDDVSLAGVRLPITPLEQRIFDLLLKVVHDQKLKTTVRVAGGWVRDKLLQAESHDIDFALDNMMGEEFALHVNEWLRANGEHTNNVSVIHANPAQSKHLETATLRLMGRDVDLVNLRSEEYTDSRIPIMKLGTAYEDAMRRDFTINSLFYNINTRLVEDYTGKGFDDLKAGLIRTPLAPKTTLMDDPLRALRAIRFSSRLRFRLHEELASALSDPEVHEALRNKVSNERMGHELEGSLKSNNPMLAMELVYRFGLDQVAFAAPGDCVEEVPFPDRPKSGRATVMAAFTLDPLHNSVMPRATAPKPSADDESKGDAADDSTGDGADESKGDGVDCTKSNGADARKSVAAAEGCLSLSSVAHDAAGGCANPKVAAAFTKRELKLLALACALVPVVGMTCTPKRKARPASILIISSQLKLSTRDSRDVQTILDSLMTMQSLVASPDRVAVGLCLRRLKHLWPIVLHMCYAFESTICDDAAELTKRVKKLMGLIEEWELEGIWERKALLNGKQLIKVFGVRGRAIGHLVQAQVEWQIQNPHGTEEQLMEVLRSHPIVLESNAQ